MSDITLFALIMVVLCSHNGGVAVLYLSRLLSYLSQTISGLTVGELKTDSKEFLYDYSYWSVDLHDNHFASQEQVRGRELHVYMK